MQNRYETKATKGLSVARPYKEKRGQGIRLENSEDATLLGLEMEMAARPE